MTYPGSLPVAAPPVAPRCDFEALYALSDPPESSHPHFAIYPRVSVILGEVDERAAALARRSKPLSAILPKNVCRYAVADSQHFSVAQPINPNFARLCGNKVVSNKRWGSVTFAEMQRLESVSLSSLEACSFSLWMMSGLFSQLKHDGFNPSDPTLFNTAISSVSAALSSQAHFAAMVSTFMRSKRRESLLAHATVPVSQVQKRELTVAPGSSDGLFDQDLLVKVASQVKEDAFVSSSMSMAKLALSGSSVKTGRNAASGSARSASGSGSSGYQSSRSFGVSSGERSASPARDGGGKRFRGSRGGAPSSKPSGFRKWEPYLCLSLIGSCLSLHWQAWRDRGADPWVVEVLRWGYRIPFARVPPLSQDPIPMPSYAPMSTKGVALEEVTRALASKGAVEWLLCLLQAITAVSLWCGRPRGLDVQS